MVGLAPGETCPQQGRHHRPENWQVSKPNAETGLVRVQCKICGALVSYRPIDDSSNQPRRTRGARRRK